MAKISIQFDTISKELEITLDGEKVENASYVEIYPFKDGDIDTGYIELKTFEVLEDEKMFKTTRLSADKTTVEVSNEDETRKQLHKDISDAMSKRL